LGDKGETSDIQGTLDARRVREKRDANKFVRKRRLEREEGSKNERGGETAQVKAKEEGKDGEPIRRLRGSPRGGVRKYRKTGLNKRSFNLRKKKAGRRGRSGK